MSAFVSGRGGSPSSYRHDTAHHSGKLVADGPYRHLRNPPYAGVFLMNGFRREFRASLAFVDSAPSCQRTDARMGAIVPGRSDDLGFNRGDHHVCGDAAALDYLAPALIWGVFAQVFEAT